ncbi:BA14K family protein [Brucella pituitosa]|uniref:BA14K family protein n=1 Tax=Brucella pituitosa TaxID=571256 RepID=UPI000C27F3A0|nr:BA14K family protein [Brucella pituitosa]MCK4204199.1 BA14K family protein [Brucella pituitosa]PJO47790.1 BA14K family protein [Brucella pituitosa]PRA89003.1 BA14K family protein [Ochrobactrum sp. MYb29]
MKRFASSFFAACLSLGIGVPAVTASANAAQPTTLIAPTTSPGAQAPIEKVQYYDYRGDRRHWRHHRPRYRDGYRHYRPHYRPYYRDWGPPPIYRHPPRYRPAPMYRGGNAHVRWCYNRYRSYRAYDNTFQPNYGPRRQCYSPYI